MRIAVIMLCLLAKCAMATPPSPQGLLIDWSHLVPPNYSNLSYYVWFKPPNSAVWQQIVMTAAQMHTNSTAGPDGTLFGVTALGRSNLVWLSLDLGIAPWWPDVRLTNMVRITPIGGWAVPTNTWLRKSTDLKQFTQRERYHYGSNGTVLVDHYEHPSEPRLFFTVQPSVDPPPPAAVNPQ